MIVVICVIILFALYILSIRCRRGHKGLAQLLGWSYTHRGLYGNGIPENSMRAFRRAKEAGYGIELDVHLLSDGNLAVIHDSFLKRVTGADTRVEDLTAEQLKDCYLEGTFETIPEFKSVLEMIDGEIPLIVEIKVVENNFKELCQAVCSALDNYNGPYCIESFDPRCVRWFKKNRPEVIRGQLSENYLKAKGGKTSVFLKFLLTFQMLGFLTAPDFIAPKFRHRKNLSNWLCRKLWKAEGVVWTVKTQDEYDLAIKEGWIPIFEGFTP